MASKYTVTVQQVITTEIEVTAESAADARRQIEEYGPTEAAMDMATNDIKTDRIKSVRKTGGAA